MITLNTGDVILTGTPAGVGPAVKGDKLQCGLEEDGKLVAKMEFTVDKD